MSTKNLARTIIEGGRAKSARHEERVHTLAERVAVRDYCRKALFDPERELLVDRDQPYGNRNHRDRLSPLHAWLQAQVGRRWDDVYRISRKFDERRLRNRHLKDHLRGMVSPAQARWRRSFYIDDEGVLRWDGGYRRHNYRKRPPGPPKKKLNAWSKGRLVLDRGIAQFWVTPLSFVRHQCGGPSYCAGPHESADLDIPLTAEEWQALPGWQKRRSPVVRDAKGRLSYYKTTHVFFCRQPLPMAQGARLTRDEEAFWRALPPHVKQAYLAVKLSGPRW